MTNWDGYKGLFPSCLSHLLVGFALFPTAPLLDLTATAVIQLEPAPEGSSDRSDDSGFERYRDTDVEDITAYLGRLSQL